MILIDAEQGSDLWFQARLGRATASCFADILAQGQGIMRKKYLWRLAAERLTGKPTPTYRNAEMDRGTEQEPDALRAYEARTGGFVERVGFMQHDTIEAGASPDGVTADRGVECKSVIPTVQIETVLDGQMPRAHIAQVQGGMWISGLAQWDFVSFSPDFKDDHLRLFVQTIKRDDEFIDKKLAPNVVVFLQEVDALVAKLQERK